MTKELTLQLLKLVSQNAALQRQVNRLQAQIKFLKQNCDCPPPPAAAVALNLSKWRDDAVHSSLLLSHRQ